jgi:hypothetical protein
VGNACWRLANLRDWNERTRWRSSRIAIGVSHGASCSSERASRPQWDSAMPCYRRIRSKACASWWWLTAADPCRPLDARPLQADGVPYRVTSGGVGGSRSAFCSSIVFGADPRAGALPCFPYCWQRECAGASSFPSMRALPGRDRGRDLSTLILLVWRVSSGGPNCRRIRLSGARPLATDGELSSSLLPPSACCAGRGRAPARTCTSALYEEPAVTFWGWGAFRAI